MALIAYLILGRFNKNIKKKLKQLADYLVELVFPSRCVICGSLGDFWCSKCRKITIQIEAQTCPTCNQISPKGKYCSRHRPGKALSGIITSGYFKEATLKKVIYAYKYEGVSALSEILAEKIYTTLKKEGLGFDLISFVPTTRKRQSWRGYNQAEELAKILARETSIPLAPSIKKKSDSKPQVGLTQKERRQNLTGKFIYKNSGGLIKGKRILLIDDVVTTGATLNECALIYKKSGARSVWGAVLAKE